MRFQLAINRSHRGKLPKDATPGQWATFNDGFSNCELTLEELSAAIREGYSITPRMRDDRRRKAENFERAQHVGIDLDSGEMTLDEVMALPIVGRHAALVHTTASHRPEHPRLRVIFLLDRPIADPEKYTLLVRALLHEFGTADPACNDAARLFFGAPGCEMVAPGNILSLEDAAVYVRSYQEMERQAAASPQARPSRSIIPGSKGMYARHLDSLLERVVMAPNGEKWRTLRDISRTMGGYVAGGYISAAEAEGYLRAAIESRRGEIANMTHAYRTIEMGVAYGQRDPLYYEESAESVDPLGGFRHGVISERLAKLEGLISDWDVANGEASEFEAILREYDELIQLQAAGQAPADSAALAYPENAQFDESGRWYSLTPNLEYWENQKRERTPGTPDSPEIAPESVRSAETEGDKP